MVIAEYCLYKMKLLIIYHLVCIIFFYVKALRCDNEAPVNSPTTFLIRNQREVNPLLNQIPAEDSEFKIIPLYHMRMIFDKTRNEAFYKALELSIVPNVSRVIDSGSGTGLLSLISAKLGAYSVFGIERHKTLFEISLQIIQNEGYQDVIHVVNKDSFSVELFKDGIDEQANLLVCEMLDASIIEEGFLEMLHDLKVRKLLKEGGIYRIRNCPLKII